MTKKSLCPNWTCWFLTFFHTFLHEIIALSSWILKLWFFGIWYYIIYFILQKTIHSFCLIVVSLDPLLDIYHFNLLLLRSTRKKTFISIRIYVEVQAKIKPIRVFKINVLIYVWYQFYVQMFHIFQYSFVCLISCVLL